ncbi:MAG: glycine cleavage system aminomethyltransferase GcvT [Gammaproteobacteria bacterium]|nr:glycine cleavage system aminomethyltransferase GcvT [Gammaproteobacteria bacterium]
MGKQTDFFERHLAAGARIVDFGGWDMPLHYGSQLDEHHAARNGAGVFDVSHMTVVDVAGADSRNWLRRLLANDVGRLSSPGKGLYSCMLNPAGGVIDDLIVYRRRGSGYRVIVNAATRDTDLEWMQATAADFDVAINERSDLAMLAVQGPAAREKVAPLLPEGLGKEALQLGTFESLDHDDVFVARTGYTGEDGWEILLEPAAARKLWDALIAAGVQPCGLGARDTLRLEAGLNLYGQDMDTQTSPLVSNLGWTVCWEPGDRDFIGRKALEEQREKELSHRLVGLVLEDRGVIRTGQRVVTDAGDGRVTSGGFSPTLECSIALARVPADAGEHCEVEIRSNLKPARVVRPPFVKQGQRQV